MVEDAVYQLIYETSLLIGASSSIVVYVLSRIHFNGKHEALKQKVEDMAKKLESTSDVVTQHDVQLKTGIAVVKELIPEAQKIVDDNKAKIDALTAEIDAKTAALNEMKKTLPSVAPIPQPTTTTQ